MASFKVVSEKAARKIIATKKPVVFMHTKSSCPVCDVFIPEVMLPLSKDERYKDIQFLQITENLMFPVGSHPVTYFFREGVCTQHPAGAAPMATVRNLLDTMYLGKVAPLLDIKTS
jgi:hypothetical protein|tara:strand:- start:253 stop:600 length:348 start_codon:yes stop_codon:yes gene_type:complete